MHAQYPLLFLLLTCAATNLQAASASSAMAAPATKSIASAVAVAAAHKVIAASASSAALAPAAAVSAAPVHVCNSHIERETIRIRAALHHALNSPDKQALPPEMLALIAVYLVATCNTVTLPANWGWEGALDPHALVLKHRDLMQTNFARFDIEKTDITGRCHVPTPLYSERSYNFCIGEAFLVPHKTADDGSHAIIVCDSTESKKSAQRFEISSDFNVGQPQQYPYVTRPAAIHRSGHLVISDGAVVDIRTTPWPRHPLPASIAQPESAARFSTDGHWLAGQTYKRQGKIVENVIVYPFDQNNAQRISDAKGHALAYNEHQVKYNYFIIAPDGSRCILASRDWDGNPTLSLWQADPTTGEFKQSCPTKVKMRSPKFSPNAEVVCATTTSIPGTIELFSAHNGQTLLTLAQPGYGQETHLVGDYVVHETSQDGMIPVSAIRHNDKIDIHYVGDVYAKAEQQQKRRAKALLDWKKLLSWKNRMRISPAYKKHIRLNQILAAALTQYDTDRSAAAAPAAAQAALPSIAQQLLIGPRQPKKYV